MPKITALPNTTVPAATDIVPFVDNSGTPTTRKATVANLAASAAFGDEYVAQSLVDAKGDLIVATADNTVTRVAAGTNDHVLTADSTEASGVKWAAAGGGGGGGIHAADSVLGVPGVTLGAHTVIGTSASRSYFSVFVVEQDITISSVSIVVSTASLTASDICRISLYQKSTTAVSESLTLVEDFGTVLCDSTGQKTITLGTPRTLTRGVYASNIITPDESIGLSANFAVIPQMSNRVNVVSASTRPAVNVMLNADQSAELASGAGATKAMNLVGAPLATHQGWLNSVYYNFTVD